MPNPKPDALAKARELAQAICADVDMNYPAEQAVSLVVAALESARRTALEEAAKECEGWWEIFNFSSFAPNDIRRCANPNHIAERIRLLKGDSNERV